MIRRAAKRASDRQAVEAGHVQVDEQDVEPAGASQPHRLLAVLSPGHLVTAALEHVEDQLEVERVVFGDQDSAHACHRPRRR